MCSLAYLGHASSLAVHTEKSGKCKVRKKRTFQCHSWPTCTVTVYIQCIALTGGEKWGLTCLWPSTLPSPYPSLHTVPCYFLASLPSLPFCLTSVATSFLSTSHDSLLPSPITDSVSSSRLASFLLSCCGRHARTLTFSSFLSTSLALSLFLPFPLHLPCLLFFIYFLPFLCVSIYVPFTLFFSPHAGDWNVSSLCLRSWGWAVS